MPDVLEKSKIAIVHDWLTGINGADRVVIALHEMFPNAPIFLLFHDEGYTRSFFPKAKIKVSGLQRLFRYIRRPGALLPLMPSAIESFDLGEYDLVISSSAIFSKGLVTRPKTIHVNYCHSPTRQVWDWSHEYLMENSYRHPVFLNLSQHFLRIWDHSSSARPTYYVSNSKHVSKRIAKYYRRKSQVIYPPVSVSPYTEDEHKRGYLIVSRLNPHKKIDIAVRAFNKLGWKLNIIGTGPEMKRLKRLAEPNINFLGNQTDEVLQSYLGNCIAFIMPQEEDFGIAPLEALMHGKPVLALRAGGALEYINEGINGEFFDACTEAVLANGVRVIANILDKYDSEVIKRSANRFSKERFKNEMRHYIIEKLYEKKSERLHNYPSV